MRNGYICQLWFIDNDPVTGCIDRGPDLALTPGQTTTITATSSPAAASYAWTRNGSSIGGPNTNTRIASVDSIGTYRVSVIDINGCTSNSNNLVIGSEQSDRLWLYPNPTTGAFTVRLFFGDALTENRFVSVYNPLGQVVATKEIVLTNVSDPYTKIDFDLSKQAAGTYVVKVAHKRTGKVTAGLIVKQ
ncbi:MAG: T9SS type A sorting domain-containing protein [Chitinophagaceae bacterium]|nr:T9SS type A sorting domain-containing protein [Chitinophagaceae bacterium]